MESAESPAPAGLSLNRIEAFSDGVIAIIITILVLEFKVPRLHGIENLAKALEGEILALVACVSPKVAILIFALIPVYYCVPSQPSKRRTP